MRYVLFTYPGPERVADWTAMTAAEKQADIDRVKAWFAEHAPAGRIVGGEELGWPPNPSVVRKRGITDGPFVETKEVLGGFIIVEVDAEATALEMARTWPGIVHDTDRVEVWPVGSSEAEATAQARSEAGAHEAPAGIVDRREDGPPKRHQCRIRSRSASRRLDYAVPDAGLVVRRSVCLIAI